MDHVREEIQTLVMASFQVSSSSVTGSDTDRDQPAQGRVAQGSLWQVRTALFLLGVAWLTGTGCDPRDPGASPRTVSPAAPAVTSTTINRHSFQYEGPMPQSFSEAPSLAVLVAKGELPPVAERLPEQPLVVPPVERIGKYGGTWRRAFTGPSDRQNIDRILHDHVIYCDLDGSTLMPHIARSWEVADNGRVFIFYLRKGMRWSDGHPFTADDFVFAYEDILLNDELNPAKPEWLRRSGKLGTVTRIDDYTVQYKFREPYHVFLEIYAGLRVAGLSAAGYYFRTVYAPSHYLKQFHPKYADPQTLDQKIKEAGFDSWKQLFRQSCATHNNRDLPVLGPWKVVQPITGQLFVLERNPYYWAVDPNGNQLPYIDRIAMHLATDLEVLNLRAVQGLIDMQHRHIQLAKVPLLKREAKTGNYRVLFWPNRGGTDCGIFINQTYDEDEEILRWLRNRDFRIALSLAVDRDAINELIFLGTGTPRAFICPPDTRYYPGSEYERKNAHFDLAQANATLDHLGLEQRDREGFRMRKDGGGRLVLSLAAVGAAFIDFTGIAELLAAHWEKMGLKIHVNIEERSLFTTRRNSNEHQLSLWGTGGSENPWAYPSFTVPTTIGMQMAPLIGAWYQSEGQKGVEPKDDIKRLIELYEQGSGAPTAQRIALGQELWRIHVHNQFIIGTVGLSPAFNGVVVVKNNFRNVPDVAPNSAILQNPGVARPEQFFFNN